MKPVTQTVDQESDSSWRSLKHHKAPVTLTSSLIWEMEEEEGVADEEEEEEREAQSGCRSHLSEVARVASAQGRG